jgi:hypothetical protein
VLNKDGKAGAGQGKAVEYNIIGKFVISDPWNLQGQIPVSWTQMVKMVERNFLRPHGIHCERLVVYNGKALGTKYLEYHR